jgi:hypothetical protein
MAIRPVLKIAGDSEKRKLEDVWGKKLARPFTALSRYFIDNNHRLRYPITPTEFMLIVHLLRFKWDERMPFPAFSTLAKNMIKSEQAVRAAARSLEKKGYLQRHMVKGRPNQFDLQPLFDKLETLYDKDQAAAADKAKTKRKKAV